MRMFYVAAGAADGETISLKRVRGEKVSRWAGLMVNCHLTGITWIVMATLSQGSRKAGNPGL